MGMLLPAWVLAPGLSMFGFAAWLTDSCKWIWGQGLGMQEAASDVYKEENVTC
jgi:hypothetical protein